MVSFSIFYEFCKNIKILWKVEQFWLDMVNEEGMELLDYDAIAGCAGHMISNDETIATDFAQGFWELITETEVSPEDCFEDYWPYFKEYATEEEYEREKDNPLVKAQIDAEIDAFYRAGGL